MMEDELTGAGRVWAGLGWVEETDNCSAAKCTEEANASFGRGRGKWLGSEWAHRTVGERLRTLDATAESDRERMQHVLQQRLMGG